MKALPASARPALRLTALLTGALSLLVLLPACDKADANKAAEPGAGTGSTAALTSQDQATLELLQSFFEPDPDHRAGRWHRTEDQMTAFLGRQAQIRKVSVESLQEEIKAWTAHAKGREDLYLRALAALADGQITVAADHAAKAYTAAMRLKGQSRQNVRLIAQLWAESLMDQDRFSDAANAYTKALALTEETQEKALWIEIQENRAYAYWRHRRFADMVQSMRAAVTARKTEPDFQVEPLCYALVFWGDGLREQKGLAEAKTVLEEAAALMAKLPSFSPVLKYETLCTLSEIYLDQEKLNEALPLAQEAHALTQKSEPLAVPDPARAAFQIGRIFFLAGKFEEAAPFIQQAAESYAQAGKNGELRLIICLQSQSIIASKLGRNDEAIQVCERLLPLMEKAPEGLDFRLSDVCNNLGQTYYVAQRFPEAEAQLQKAVTLIEQRLGPDHPDLAVPLANLALAIAGQNRFSEAEPLIWDAVAIDMRASVIAGKLVPGLVPHTRLFAGMMDAGGVASEEKSNRVRELARETQLPDALWQEFVRQIMGGAAQ